MKAGFITPESKVISMTYNKVLDYCEKLCNQEQYKNKFSEFSKDYHYFSPYFDFVMFELHYIFINPLFNTGTYLGVYQDSLYFNQLESFNYEDNMKSLYELAKYDTILPYITKCSNQSLSIETQYSNNIKTCMIDPCLNGMISSTDVTGISHGITANTVMNQFVLTNPEIASDYYCYVCEKGIDKDLDPINYMIQRLGFLRATSPKDGYILIGNQSAFTDMQRKLVDKCIKNNYSFYNTDPSLSDISSFSNNSYQKKN